MRSRNFKRIINTAQILLWVVLILIFPLSSFLTTFDIQGALKGLPRAMMFLLPVIIVYVLNYFWLIPKGLLGDSKPLFYWGNVVLFLLVIADLVIRNFKIQVPEGIPFNRWSVISIGAIYKLVTQLVVIMLAVGFRYMERYYELQEKAAVEKQEAAAAELAWLKNQINPHFLFNTLNNISSLTQIDADKAQDSISQLSDLLRYTLYETDADTVPLDGEVEFLRNYIDLMALRCNDSVRIGKSFDLPKGTVKVAPLLFISLVENAFKHGVSTRNDSFIDVDMHQDGEDIVFECRNSLFEKAGTDRAGSGIGIENLRRRLDLIYPGSYEYEQKAADGVYSAKVVLKGIC